MEILNYALGIDVSKDKIDCCLSQMDSNRNAKVLAIKLFSNDVRGFKSLVDWTVSNSKTGIPLTVVLEATGVYYENLAHYFFSNSNYTISVLLPIKAKYYFKSLDLKTKTDKVDAQMLAQFGLERRLPVWEPISSTIRPIKQLSREYRDLKTQINRLKNRLHAKKHAYQTNPLVIKLINENIKLIERQFLQIEAELQELVHSDSYLSDKIDRICSIPGIGFMTAICIVAETNGFKLMRNSKQLCSYAGLDVKHNISGSKSGKSTLSKRGNKYIRHALYMSALTASRRIPRLSDFYQRINDKNKCKKIGLLAVSRKLLVLTYTLWRKDEDFALA